MGQFTFHIDEELRRAAKVYAARHGTTLSSLVRDLLVRKIGWREEMVQEPDGPTTRAVLVDYGDGLIERSEALRLLGKDPSEVIWLRDRINDLGLDWPRQDRADAEAQSDFLIEIMTEGEE